MKYKSEPTFGAISVREFTRNFSYHADSEKPVVVEKHGEVIGVWVPPEQFFGEKKPKKKKQKLSDSPFFKDFVEPPEWKGRSTEEIAEELRRKAWYGEDDE